MGGVNVFVGKIFEPLLFKAEEDSRIHQKEREREEQISSSCVQIGSSPLKKEKKSRIQEGTSIKSNKSLFFETEDRKKLERKFLPKKRRPIITKVPPFQNHGGRLIRGEGGEGGYRFRLLAASFLLLASIV